MGAPLRVEGSLGRLGLKVTEDRGHDSLIGTAFGEYDVTKLVVKTPVVRNSPLRTLPVFIKCVNIKPLETDLTGTKYRDPTYYAELPTIAQVTKMQENDVLREKRAFDASTIFINIYAY